jgi:Domain of unknown function (DUF1937)
VKKLVYLAVPYTHPDLVVREGRFNAVNRHAALLMKQGLHVISPISHSHPIALAGGLPTDWQFWEAYDRAILETCSKLIVLKLDGWEESVGVQAEIRIAKKLGIPIEYNLQIV